MISAERREKAIAEAIKLREQLISVIRAKLRVLAKVELLIAKLLERRKNDRRGTDRN